MIEDIPAWRNDDPNNWSTRWKAYYQIVGSPEVCVDAFCHSEKGAMEQASKALKEALGKVVDLQIKVEASCWTVKHQTRTRTRIFPAENVETFVTRNWYSSFTTVLKSVYKQQYPDAE